MQRTRNCDDSSCCSERERRSSIVKKTRRGRRRVYSFFLSFFLYFACSPLSLSPLRARPLYAAPNDENKRNYEPNTTDVTSDYHAQLSTPLGIIHPTCINSLRRLTLRSLSPASVSTFFTALERRDAPFTFVRSFERLIL